MKMIGNNAIISLGLLAFIFLAICIAQYMPLRESMDTDSLDTNKSVDENTDEKEMVVEDEMEIANKKKMASENEKREKLQSISQETTNMTENMNNMIKKSRFDVNKMTNAILQELENRKKNMMIERENVSKQAEFRVREIQNSNQNVMDSVVTEKGVHIEIA